MKLTYLPILPEGIQIVSGNVGVTSAVQLSAVIQGNVDATITNSSINAQIQNASLNVVSQSVIVQVSNAQLNTQITNPSLQVYSSSVAIIEMPVVSIEASSMSGAQLQITNTVQTNSQITNPSLSVTSSSVAVIAMPVVSIESSSLSGANINVLNTVQSNITNASLAVTSQSISVIQMPTVSINSSSLSGAFLNTSVQNTSLQVYSNSVAVVNEVSINSASISGAVIQSQITNTSLSVTSGSIAIVSMPSVTVAAISAGTIQINNSSIATSSLSTNITIVQDNVNLSKTVDYGQQYVTINDTASLTGWAYQIYGGTGGSAGLTIDTSDYVDQVLSSVVLTLSSTGTGNVYLNPDLTGFNRSLDLSNGSNVIFWAKSNETTGLTIGLLFQDIDGNQAGSTSTITVSDTNWHFYSFALPTTGLNLHGITDIRPLFNYSGGIIAGTIEKICNLRAVGGIPQSLTSDGHIKARVDQAASISNSGIGIIGLGPTTKTLINLTGPGVINQIWMFDNESAQGVNLTYQILADGNDITNALMGIGENTIYGMALSLNAAQAIGVNFNLHGAGMDSSYSTFPQESGHILIDISFNSSFVIKCTNSNASKSYSTGATVLYHAF